jgi:hypothetical protein
MHYDLLPIADAPRNGGVVLLHDDAGDWTAVGFWTGDMWAIGRPEQGCPVQIEFEPAFFSYPAAG